MAKAGKVEKTMSKASKVAGVKSAMPMKGMPKGLKPPAGLKPRGKRGA